MTVHISILICFFLGNETVKKTQLDASIPEAGNAYKGRDATEPGAQRLTR